MQSEAKEHYVVLEKTTEAPGVFTLALALPGGGIPPFTAGQFVTVYFPDSGTREGKAYSISSAPEEPSLSITVRAIGEFSNRLSGLRPQDTLTASLPYGYFASEDEKGGLALLAAGIGITPMRSIIRDAIKKNSKKRIVLFHTGRSIADMVFKNEFDALQRTHQNFTAHYFITREHTIPAGTTNRRMQAKDILEAVGDFNNFEFMICGAIPFVSDLWRSLHKGGVPEDAISTEAFFSR
jgi:ferredoxin-NADP reductase